MSSDFRPVVLCLFEVAAIAFGQDRGTISGTGGELEAGAAMVR